MCTDSRFWWNQLRRSTRMTEQQLCCSWTRSQIALEILNDFEFVFCANFHVLLRPLCSVLAWDQKLSRCNSGQTPKPSQTVQRWEAPQSILRDGVCCPKICKRRQEEDSWSLPQKENKESVAQRWKAMTKQDVRELALFATNNKNKLFCCWSEMHTRSVRTAAIYGTNKKNRGRTSANGKWRQSLQKDLSIFERPVSRCYSTKGICLQRWFFLDYSQPLR